MLSMHGATMKKKNFYCLDCYILRIIHKPSSSAVYPAYEVNFIHWIRFENRNNKFKKPRYEKFIM